MIVGPACGYQIEVYGTDGSVKWDFERMNELQVRIGRAADEPGLHHRQRQPQTR